MFRNRALNVSLAKTPASTDAPSPIETTACKLIDKINTQTVIKVTAGALAVYAAVVAINTASTIAENRFSPSL